MIFRTPHETDIVVKADMAWSSDVVYNIPPEMHEFFSLIQAVDEILDDPVYRMDPADFTKMIIAYSWKTILEFAVYMDRFSVRTDMIDRLSDHLAKTIWMLFRDEMLENVNLEITIEHSFAVLSKYGWRQMVATRHNIQQILLEEDQDVYLYIWKLLGLHPYLSNAILLNSKAIDDNPLFIRKVFLAIEIAYEKVPNYVRFVRTKFAEILFAKSLNFGKYAVKLNDTDLLSLNCIDDNNVGVTLSDNQYLVAREEKNRYAVYEFYTHMYYVMHAMIKLFTDPSIDKFWWGYASRVSIENNGVTKFDTKRKYYFYRLFEPNQL